MTQKTFFVKITNKINIMEAKVDQAFSEVMDELIHRFRWDFDVSLTSQIFIFHSRKQHTNLTLQSKKTELQKSKQNTRSDSEGNLSCDSEGEIHLNYKKLHLLV